MNPGQLDNQTLQSTALGFVKRLRSFQEDISRTNNEATMARHQEMAEHHTDTQQEKTLRWNRHNTEDQRRRDSQKNKWLSEFRTDATLLYEELLKRTGERRVLLVALDNAMLAGVNPVEEVAHQIEKLARKLSGPSPVTIQ